MDAQSSGTKTDPRPRRLCCTNRLTGNASLSRHGTGGDSARGRHRTGDGLAPHHRRHMVRPKRRDARRASLRAIAPAVSDFQGLAFLRGGLMAAAPRAAVASVALAGVEGAVRCPATVCLQTVRGGDDACNLRIGRNLVQQFEQHGRVTEITGGKFGCADFQCLLVNSNVDLAPDAPFGTAVLARVPLPFALGLDACAVRQRFVFKPREGGAAGATARLIHNMGS